MSEKVCLCDLDGTLCDYEGQLVRDLNAIAGPDDFPIENLYSTDWPDWFENRINIIRRVPGWWLGLNKIKLGFDILDYCRYVGFDIRILTKGPRRTRNAWTEKVDWCHEHVMPNHPEAQVTITEDKGLVYGRVLVDDYIPYMERWLQWRPRGLGVVPAQKWNEGYSHPNVIRYTGENSDELLRELERAFNRESE